MDLLFKRYASPFLLLDQMIRSVCFSEFVKELAENEIQDYLWELFLHKVEGKTFEDFLEECDVNQKNSPDDNLETTINYSFDLLNNFKPQKA